MACPTAGPPSTRFTRHLDRRRRARQPQGLARIELQKVDALADVRIGLGPVLSHLESKPRTKLQMPLADESRSPQQKIDTLAHSRPRPLWKRRERSLHSLLRNLNRRLRMRSNHLRRTRRVRRRKTLRRPHALAADHQAVLPAEFAADPLQRLDHVALRCSIVEVGKGFVLEGRKHISHRRLSGIALATS